ncbi:MAG: rRNA maturation RNase YbeY [bacterium]
MNIDINNLTEFDLMEARLKTIIETLTEREQAPHDQLSVAFVGDDRMRDMNEEYYNEDGTTDVLTFDYEDGSIEITLNPYQHYRQAPDANNTLPEETVENLVHGYLHTCGYNHLQDNGEHLERQLELMDELKTFTDLSSLISPPEELTE